MDDDAHISISIAALIEGSLDLIVKCQVLIGTKRQVDPTVSFTLTAVEVQLQKLCSELSRGPGGHITRNFFRQRASTQSGVMSEEQPDTINSSCPPSSEQPESTESRGLVKTVSFVRTASDPTLVRHQSNFSSSSREVGGKAIIQEQAQPVQRRQHSSSEPEPLNLSASQLDSAVQRTGVRKMGSLNEGFPDNPSRLSAVRQQMIDNERYLMTARAQEAFQILDADRSGFLESNLTVLTNI